MTNKGSFKCFVIAVEGVIGSAYFSVTKMYGPKSFDRISVSTYSEMCKKIGSPLSFGAIKPCPFSRQNVLIMPRKLGPAAATSDLHHETKRTTFTQIY